MPATSRYGYPTTSSASDPAGGAIITAGADYLFPWLKSTGGTIHADILDALTAGRLAVGDIIQWAAYWQGSDLGSGTGRIVAAATGTDDGGSYIDAGSYQIEQVFGDDVPASRFGVSPTRTGTQNSTALQAAIDYATPADFSTGTAVRLPTGAAVTYSTGVTLPGRPVTLLAYGATSEFDGTGSFITIDSTGSTHPDHSKPSIVGGRWEYTGAGSATCFHTKDATGVRILDLDVHNFTSWSFIIENVNAWTENVMISEVHCNCGGSGGFLRQHGPTGTGTTSQARTRVDNVYCNSNAQYVISVETGAYDSSWKRIKGNLGTSVDAVMNFTTGNNSNVIEDLAFEGGQPTEATYYVRLANSSASAIPPVLRGTFQGRDNINADPITAVSPNASYPGGHVEVLRSGLALGAPGIRDATDGLRPWAWRRTYTATKDVATEIEGTDAGAMMLLIASSDLGDNNFAYLYACLKPNTFLAPTLTVLASRATGNATASLTWSGTNNMLLTWTGGTPATANVSILYFAARAALL